MFTMRKFCALVFLSLMWVNLAWAENFYYVEADSTGDSIKYVVVENGSGYDSSQWSKTAVQTETTLTALFEKICYGGTTYNADAIVEKATVYLKAGTYNVKSFIHIQGKTAANVYKVYGGFAGTESGIDARDTKANETILDGSGLTNAKDTANHSYVHTTHLSSIIYINMSTHSEGDHYRDDQSNWGNTAQATVTLDGLTLTNAGKTNYASSNAATFFGGAIRIEGGNVTINDCDITNNISLGSGGAIYVDSGQGDEANVVTTITNCNITGNTTRTSGGGGGICVGSSGNDKGKVVIRNCNISDNESNCYYGGGIFIWYGWVTEMDGCTIMNNKASGASYGGFGAGICVYSNSENEASEIKMENCTIANNNANANDKTGYGGGLWVGNYSKATVINCSFINNVSTYYSEIYRDSKNTNTERNTTITNSLIWGDTSNFKWYSVYDTKKSLTLKYCAYHATSDYNLQVTPENCISDIDNSTSLTSKTQEVNGITHTVYRIEDNDALSALAGAGTSDNAPEKDQLGHTRNTPPCIGAVEKVNVPTLPQASYTITGTEGTPITPLEITASGLDIVWSISGVLPTGLTASSTDKTFTISGTPEIGTAKTDAYTYTLKATNSAGTATATINITIKAINPVLDMTGEITKTFTEGVKIDTITITATTGNDRLTWTADSSALPKGLTGTAATDNKSFTISGTPDTGSAGSYTYTVTATNVTGTTASATFKITVNSALAITASKTSISATEGTAIESITISSNSDESLTWTADASKLPDGLTGSAAKDGKSFTISGTPKTGTAKTEAYSYTVSAKNSAGETATASITITVNKAAAAETAPVLDTSSVNVSVNEGNEIEAITITATAGTNLTWTTSGDLPEDLTGTPASDKMSFTISGIPSNRTARIDAYTYKVTAANTAGSASAVITITVNSTGGINDEVSNALETLASTGESMTLEDALTGRLGLTTEQLKTVTSITIPDNITDLGDLSTLLPNLEAIDLTSATSLTEVNLKGNTSIKEVTITGNSNVKTLDLTDCSVETLDATGCDELTEVNIAGNTNIQTLSLDECPNIEGFNAEGCENLTNLSLSNKGSEGRRGKLSSLNLTGCRNLKELAFKGNMMKRFHVTDFSLNSLETLSAGDQAVGNVKLSKRFSFIDFFLNLLFNSNVSVSISNSHSKLTAVEVIIATASGDKNVKSVTAYDNSGVEIDGDYDSETGEAVFISTPARIEYDYDTGFDSEESMDVAISGESVEDESDMTLDNPGGSGGCNSSFASGALLALLGFVIARKKHNKDSEK